MSKQVVLEALRQFLAKICAEVEKYPRLLPPQLGEYIDLYSHQSVCKRVNVPVHLH